VPEEVRRPSVARRFSVNLLPIQSERFRFMPGLRGSRSRFGLPPGEVTGLVLARGDKRCTVLGNTCTSEVDCTEPEEACVVSAQLEWLAESGSSSYNLYRSSVASHSVCRWPDLPSTSFIDYEGDPYPGSVFHYLATGRNVWGESVLGSRSDGAARPNPEPCP
jgi:hypothetical protein